MPILIVFIQSLAIRVHVLFKVLMFLTMLALHKLVAINLIILFSVVIRLPLLLVLDLMTGLIDIRVTLCLGWTIARHELWLWNLRHH